MLLVGIGAMVRDVGTALSVFVMITIGVAQCMQVGMGLSHMITIGTARAVSSNRPDDFVQLTVCC